MPRLKWTEKDNDFLKSYYPTKTAIWCADHLNRSKNAIHLHAKSLGLNAIGRSGCRKTRKILQRLSEGFVTCFCPRHSMTKHRVYANGDVKCMICTKIYENKRKGNRVWTDHTRHLSKMSQRKRRSTLLGKYTNRIRACLYQCSVGRISFSKHLPYDTKELCEHLEKIRNTQNNECPMCRRSYGKVQDSIDHIVPIATAKTIEELLGLFSLSNLSLLCLSCNSTKGAKI